MLATAFLAFSVVLAVVPLVGNRTVARLRQIAPLDPGRCPPVTVVVAARNEGTHVGPALASLARQDYPALDIVFVDDRSEDDTRQRAEAVAAADARVRVVHVETLPDGWLGKNHALHVGAGLARGEYLLFTDADVVLEPTALRRGVAIAEARGVDLLAVTPRIDVPGYWLAALLGGFFTFFTIYIQPYLARFRYSGAYVGFGAFNLVRAATYRAIGGHGPIRLRPDDDLALGRLMRAEGRRLDVAYGDGEVSVVWYRSFGEMMRGLEKNTFAGMDYRVAATLASVAAMVVVTVAPVVGLALDTGAPLLAWGASWALMAVLGADCARRIGLPRSSGLWLPAAAVVQGGLFLRGMWLVWRRGGIVWRGTFYPIDALKAHRWRRRRRA